MWHADRVGVFRPVPTDGKNHSRESVGFRQPHHRRDGQGHSAPLVGRPQENRVLHRQRHLRSSRRWRIFHSRKHLLPAVGRPNGHRHRTFPRSRGGACPHGLQCPCRCRTHADSPYDRIFPFPVSRQKERYSHVGIPVVGSPRAALVPQHLPFRAAGAVRLRHWHTGRTVGMDLFLRRRNDSQLDRHRARQTARPACLHQDRSFRRHPHRQIP